MIIIGPSVFFLSWTVIDPVFFEAVTTLQHLLLSGLLMISAF
jgi:hypothetical protein